MHPAIEVVNCGKLPRFLAIGKLVVRSPPGEQQAAFLRGLILSYTPFAYYPFLAVR
jgi:hypothetical protein